MNTYLVVCLAAAAVAAASFLLLDFATTVILIVVAVLGVGAWFLARWLWARRAAVAIRPALRWAWDRRQYWAIALGGLFVLLGLLVPSQRLLWLGAILVVGWLLSDWLTRMALIAQSVLVTTVTERSNRETALKGTTPAAVLTEDQVEELNELADDIRCARLKRNALLVARTVACLATANLAVCLLLSYGPGNIFPWDLYEASQKPMVQAIVSDAKKGLRWDANRMSRLHRLLRVERELTEAEFRTIVDDQHFDLDAILDATKASKLYGAPLVADLKRTVLVRPQAVQPPPIFKVGMKSWGQEIRENFWLTLIWAKIAIWLVILGHLLLLALQVAREGLYQASDEIKDAARKGWEEYKNFSSGSGSTKSIPPSGPSASGSLKDKLAEAVKHILNIAVISGVLDWFFGRYLDRKLA